MMMMMMMYLIRIVGKEIGDPSSISIRNYLRFLAKGMYPFALLPRSGSSRDDSDC